MHLLLQGMQPIPVAIMTTSKCILCVNDGHLRRITIGRKKLEAVLCYQHALMAINLDDTADDETKMKALALLALEMDVQ